MRPVTLILSTIAAFAVSGFAASRSEAMAANYCATEGGYCACHDGTVFYGERDTWVARSTDDQDGIPCNNGVFGDPLYGVVKQCRCKGDSHDSYDDDVKV